MKNGYFWYFIANWGIISKGLLLKYIGIWARLASKLPTVRSHMVGYEVPKCPGDHADDFRPWSLYGYYEKIAYTGK